MGASGAGKSTLLDVLAGRKDKGSGALFVDCSVAFLISDTRVTDHLSISH